MANIYCLLCNKSVGKFYTTFFYDKKGRYRHGSICKRCYKTKKPTPYRYKIKTKESEV